MKHLSSTISDWLFQLNRQKLIAAKVVIFCCISVAFTTAHSQQRVYEVPPSSVATELIPALSDEAMEQCVKTYNEAAWLKNELNNAQVDLAQPAQVDAYNIQASRYSELADYYNNNCAGKQSNLANAVVQQLNQRSD